MKQLVLFLAGLVAPVVTLFYRKGIWVTPDDPVSPYGMYEPFMQKLYARFGTFIGDWWWLGIRNTAYGLAYKWKPDEFKVDSYDNIGFSYIDSDYLRKISAFALKDGEEHGKVYTEYMFRGPFFHVIWGYRIRPMYDTAMNEIPVRPINMDGRPIFSIRWGRNDD